MKLKSYLKRVSLLYRLNAIIKAWRCERHYKKVCRHYATIGVKTGLPVSLFSSTPISLNGNKPKVLFCGAARDQDYSGMIQSLERLASVSVFSADRVAATINSAKKLSEEEVQAKVSEAFLNQYKKLKQQNLVDLVIGQFHKFFISADTLRQIRKEGLPVVNISMDDRLSFDPGRQIGASYFFGTVSGTTTTCPEAVSWYLQEGEKTLYWPEASDPSFFSPRSHRDIDVIFVGSRYGVREKFVRALQKAEVSVQAYGPGWENGPVDSEKMADLFGRAKIVLGVGCVEHSHHLRIIKLRDFDGPMSGACYVTTYTPDLLQFYEIGKEIICYKDEKDCVRVIQRLLANSEEREKIGAAGRSRATREHTWDQRWHNLLAWTHNL